ncbi:MAG: fibronectin type III domain-containing protein [Elusimicrobiota bacterium]
MKKFFLLGLILVSSVFLYAAGLRLGMTGAVKEKVKELDEKVREKKAATSASFAPADLTAVVVSSVQINLSWTESVVVTGFKIERSPDNTTFTQIASVTPKSYSDTGLTAATTYWYRVRAYNSDGNSAYSNVASTRTSLVPAFVTGFAAAGAPIIGYAYLKDSSPYPAITKGPTAIAIDGKFSFDVTGLTPPFYLRADGAVGGNSYDLYSCATGAGTANINPLSSVAVAAAAGVTNPASVYANSSLTPITQTNLDKAIADIQNMLKPLLDAYNANINPITGAYAANRTGLDAVFDVVKVTLSTGTGAVTVTDKTTNTQIASALTTALTTPTDTLTTGEVPATTIITDLDAIAVMLSNFVTVINKGLNLTAADLEPFYASTSIYGLNDGWNRTQDINESVSNSPTSRGNSITSITNLNIEEKIGGDYKIAALFHFSDGSFGAPDDGFWVTKENNSWKTKGNGFKLDLDIDFETHKRLKADGSVQIYSGINCWAEDDGNFNIQSATITGPGLPADGIIIRKPQNEPTDLSLDPAYQTTGVNSELYVMSDAVISAIPDNALYTIKVYDSSGTLVETRTVTLPKRPFMSTELTAAHFPTFGITSHALSAANIGGTLTFSYAKPTASYTTAEMYSGLSYYDGSGNRAEYRKDLLLNQTSASIINGAPAWTPVGAHFEISVDDSFRRQIEVEWDFQ